MTASGSGGGKLDAPLGLEEGIQTSCAALTAVVRAAAAGREGDGDDDVVLSEAAKEDLAAMVPDAISACVMERIDRYLDSAAVKEVEAWKEEMKRKVGLAGREGLIGCRGFWDVEFRGGGGK